MWGIGADEDGIGMRSHVLVTTHKEWSIATLHAIEELVEGTLPMGRDTVLGLEDDCSAGLWFSSRVSESIASAVVHRCSQIRAAKHRDLD